MPDNKKVLGLNPPAGWGLSVWILHVVSMSAWVLAGYSLWLLPTYQRRAWIRLTGDSKLAVGVNVSVSQGAYKDGLQSPCDYELVKQKKMDGSLCPEVQFAWTQEVLILKLL